MAEFLAKDNNCGQTLLNIVSAGNAIIAELLRLKDYIPNVFRLETKEDQTKYAEIILDFKYFKICNAQDKRIEDDENLQELDEGFRDTYIEILTRFYLAFQSIHEYIMDVKNFLYELNDGAYIQQSLESILQDNEGKQMLTETLYLYGVMLLVLDLHIPGIIRERLIVSYYRYSSEKSNIDTKIDDVVKLVYSNTFDNHKTAVGNYPEDYFQRISLDETFIEMIIGRLIADDIYNQLKVYPLPDHRTTAIANQGAMLFVCLFFSPQTLHQENARMREIVDKFFSDNWIISIYMGITLNLIDAWEPYKAAKNALISAQTNVKYIATKHIQLLKEILPKTRNILKEGCLAESMLIKNTTKVINLMRNCNVTLRWLMLHTTDKCVMSFRQNKRSKHIYEQIIAIPSYESIELFELLLNTSQLELKVYEILKELLSEKEEKWNKYKYESSDRMKELSEVFSGKKPLSRIEKNSNLCDYFEKIATEINGLCFNEPNVSGRKCIQIIQALEDVEPYHNLDTNMQIKQYLNECRQYLHQMIQILNIKEETIINIQLIGDFSYAWYCIDNFTIIMQENIVNQPNLVIKLRATFLKLASALEIPLLRINQAQSEDLLSVSQYYSNELVKYLRKVIQIIPKTMFEILAKIIHLQTEVICELPTRLEKEKLKEYAQLEERYTVAKLTYSISVFTEGILMMQKTLVGVIELDPKQLLEDGIRKELVKHLTETLHNGLIFNSSTNKSSAKISNLGTVLKALAKQIDGYRRSFEYVQDYLNILGCKIWHEEMSRIINYNVEKECNGFLRKKVQDWQSEYQTDNIPIPTFAATDSESLNFIGRLAREILKQTDPKSTIYSELRTSWLDYKTHNEIFNLKFFNQITNSIGPVGLVGLDKLYSHMIVSDLKQLLNAMHKNILKEKIWTDTLISMSQKLTPNTIIVEQPNKFYPSYITKCVKIMPIFLDWIVKIGQKQILRKQIAFELNKSCKFDAKNLDATLRTFNDAILMELRSEPKDNVPTEMLVELNKYLQWAGIYNPYHKIYTTTHNSYYYSLFLFLLTIAHVPKLNYVKNISCLTAQKMSDNIDGGPFVIGLATVLKQFHCDIMHFYIKCLCQYVFSIVHHSVNSKHGIITSESSVAFNFIKMFIRTLDISYDILEENIPNAVLTQFDYLSTKAT